MYNEVKWIMGNGQNIPSSPRTDRYDSKHYLPAMSLAGAKKDST